MTRILTESLTITYPNPGCRKREIFDRAEVSVAARLNEISRPSTTARDNVRPIVSCRRKVVSSRLQISNKTLELYDNVQLVS